MFLTSILLSLLSLPLLWLVLPIFVMPPLAFYLGWVGFKRAVLQAPESVGTFTAMLYALPMALAIAVLVAELWIMNTGYKA
ncbi:MAG: hypothetical protein LBJ15_15405 [Comamonas sp.]|uniref:hypothetical protein n=1 Tax=Comamonas sp. TaxID=34028 RepID=UPI0028379A29|nr:hypothetical protein [Comamonas sp.]MDR0215378.1 hypothetical protein [Comamonas sp.]